MMVLLFNLLQSQQTRLSWIVIVAAALVLAVGISLVVYFYRRYKRIEKEAEEDWDASGSLFARVTREPRPEINSGMSSAQAPVAAAAPVAQGATREFASVPEAPAVEVSATPSEITPQPSLPEVQTPEPRPTELLASPSPVQPAPEPKVPEEAASLEEDLWANLEVGEQPPLAPEHVVQPEPLRDARVESTSRPQPFEPPRIEPIQPRAPYEPPRIEPLSPREQAATRALHSMTPPAYKAPAERIDRPTGLFGSSEAPRPAGQGERDRQAERETLEFAAAPAAPARKEVEPSPGPAYKSRLAPAGSVLGLPSDASNQPLVLGKPVRPAEETGIVALTNYGKDLGPKGGRAGTVVLLFVLALLVGGAGVYVFVPSVHARVNALVARIRGVDAQTLGSASKPKAQVIPSFRPEVNKNMVIARGSVDNISDEPLENLEIEVSLQRGTDEPPEIRRIPVTPSPLPPNERGNFEFEYDGKRDTGFAGYKITRLLSNGSEVKFKSPAQK